MKGRMPDDLWTGFEILEGRAFGHNQTLVCSLPCLKQSFSEKTTNNLECVAWAFTRACQNSPKYSACSHSEIADKYRSHSACFRRHR